MTDQVLAPRDVQTTINYQTPLDTQPPYVYAYEPPAGVPETNIGEDVHPVVIHDARGKDAALSLGISGFQFVHYPSIEKDFVDEDRIKTIYYPEVGDILKKHTGAKRVFIFDHTIRRKPVAQKEPLKVPPRSPYYRVHADQTPVSAAQRVVRHLGDEAERLLRGRYRIINVWRPIGNTVAHSPLALADYRSVDPERDLFSTRLIHLDYEGSVFAVKYNPGHKWYYLSDQTPDEVTLIKCFDSDADSARLTPHSAFRDSTSPADAPQRESIEIRALVFDTE